MNNPILNLPKQFEWDPKIENADRLASRKKFIHAAMGGSQLACDILRQLRPDLDIIAHRSYGLPKISEQALAETLVIVNSYSGNTEETISALQEALNKNLPVIAISTGGKLLEIAAEKQIPYIKFPELGVQPRMSTGAGLKALLKAIGDNDMLGETSNLSAQLNPGELEGKGLAIARSIKGKIPVIYASDNNFALARIWKIKFNETGKVPAFWNVLPELNHNEMTGFSAFIDGISEEARGLSDKFHFLFLRDREDHERIAVRFGVLAKLFAEKNMPVTEVWMEGGSSLQKVFNSLILSDWATLKTAEQYGLEPEEVPLVEEFKKLIK